MVSISDNFDSGNISLVSVSSHSHTHSHTHSQSQQEQEIHIEVRIKDEPFTGNEQKQHKQWFHFRASGVKSSTCE
jgi:hypothetical protein